MLLLFGFCFVMGLQLVACAKKSEPPIRAGESGEEERRRAERRGGAVGDSLGMLEVIATEANQKRVAFTFAIESELRRIEGRMGRDNTNRAEDTQADGYEVFYRSYEDYSVVAAILAQKNGQSGRFFLFVENSNDRFDSLIDGISISIDREVSNVTDLVRFIMSERSITLSKAFALIIERHRKSPRATFEELDRQIREEVRSGEIDNSPEPELGVERDLRDDDEVSSDSNSRVVIRYNPCYASQNRDNPACAPSARAHQPSHQGSVSIQPHQPGTVYRPPSAHGSAPHLPSQVAPPVREIAPGAAVAVGCVPEMPQASIDSDGEAYHTWEQCLESEQWMTWGMTAWRTHEQDQEVLRGNPNCKVKWWPNCSLEDTNVTELGKCRILKPRASHCQAGQAQTVVIAPQAHVVAQPSTVHAGAHVPSSAPQVISTCNAAATQTETTVVSRCGTQTIVESPAYTQPASSGSSLMVRCVNEETGPNVVRFPNTTKINHEINDIEICLPNDRTAWAVPLKHESVWWLKRNFSSWLLGDPQYSNDAQILFHLDFSRVHDTQSAHRAVKDITLNGGGFEVVGTSGRVDGYAQGNLSGRVSKSFATAGDESCPDQILLSCDVTYYPHSAHCQ